VPLALVLLVLLVLLDPRVLLVRLVLLVLRVLRVQLVLLALEPPVPLVSPVPSALLGPLVQPVLVV
jgi:hypothetical protein